MRRGPPANDIPGHETSHTKPGTARIFGPLSKQITSKNQLHSRLDASSITTPSHHARPASFTSLLPPERDDGGRHGRQLGHKWWVRLITGTATRPDVWAARPHISFGPPSSLSRQNLVFLIDGHHLTSCHDFSSARVALPPFIIIKPKARPSCPSLLGAGQRAAGSSVDLHQVISGTWRQLRPTGPRWAALGKPQKRPQPNHRWQT
jgi:hypothetical protein